MEGEVGEVTRQEERQADLLERLSVIGEASVRELVIRTADDRLYGRVVSGRDDRTWERPRFTLIARELRRMEDAGLVRISGTERAKNGRAVNVWALTPGGPGG